MFQGALTLNFFMRHTWEKLFEALDTAEIDNIITVIEKGVESERINIELGFVECNALKRIRDSEILLAMLRLRSLEVRKLL